MTGKELIERNRLRNIEVTGLNEVVFVPIALTALNMCAIEVKEKAKAAFCKSNCTLTCWKVDSDNSCSALDEFVDKIKLLRSEIDLFIDYLEKNKE